jgi:hypothetical protein
MTNLNLGSRLVALVCTVLVSTVCLVGAVGPATATGASVVVAGKTLA